MGVLPEAVINGNSDMKVVYKVRVKLKSLSPGICKNKALGLLESLQLIKKRCSYGNYQTKLARLL